MESPVKESLWGEIVRQELRQVSVFGTRESSDIVGLYFDLESISVSCMVDDEDDTLIIKTGNAFKGLQHVKSVDDGFWTS